MEQLQKLAAVKSGEDDDATDLLETRESFFKKGETRGYLDHGSFERASLETPLPDDNRGMKLLYKMGWKKDTSLGKTGTGIIQPIQLVDASLGYGLGKQQEYDQNAEEATRNRKLLDMEVEETAELKKQRMEKAVREETLKQEIKDMNREFYCELCDKQYKTVGEMSNHLSSYDHHHTKRLKEAKEAERARKATKAGTRAKQDQALMDREMQRRIEAAQAASASRQASSSQPPPPPPAQQPPPPGPPTMQQPPAPPYPPTGHAPYPPRPAAPYGAYPPYGTPNPHHPHHHPYHQPLPAHNPYGYAAPPPPPQPPAMPAPPSQPPPPPATTAIPQGIPEGARSKISISFGLKAKVKKPVR